MSSVEFSISQTVKNIVLVHGAFVDGSGWRPVADILKKHGYKVSIVQQPLTGVSVTLLTIYQNPALRAFELGRWCVMAESFSTAVLTDERF